MSSVEREKREEARQHKTIAAQSKEKETARDKLEQMILHTIRTLETAQTQRYSSAKGQRKDKFWTV